MEKTARGLPASRFGHEESSGHVKSTAEAVVIGAGIMGCAIAHALAEHGLADVLVLERDQIGRGATADAAGGVRQQVSTETNIRLAPEVSHQPSSGQKAPPMTSSRTTCGLSWAIS